MEYDEISERMTIKNLVRMARAGAGYACGKRKVEEARQCIRLSVRSDWRMKPDDINV